MKKNLFPPINFLRVRIKGRCPYCKESETEFYDEGRTPEESKKFREEGKVKHLWVCLLRPDVAKGHRPCTYNEWREECPFYK